LGEDREENRGEDSNYSNNYQELNEREGAAARVSDR
jgi:hypothetical protein